MSHITRRSLTVLSASALAWAAARRGLGSTLPDAFFTDASQPRSLLTQPVKVPQDFVGMHAHRWPSASGATVPPTYAFGAARSHDHDGISWNGIHLAPNRYAWDNLDRWVSAHSDAGRTLIYTLYGTPAWLADTPEKRDLYGRPGGASNPRELTVLNDFICALTLRYNSSGQRRIHQLETWNEPHFDGDSRDYWWGTAEQLVAVGRTVHIAAKQVDPGIRVLSPGFVGDLTGAFSLRWPTPGEARRSSLYQYLTARDGHGGKGSRWCDGIAFHTYNVALGGENIGYIQDLARLNKLLAMMGVALPIYNTECGFIAPHPFRSISPAEQAMHLRRLGALQAALGVQGLYLYSHDDDLVGNPSAHPEIASAIDQLHRHLAGATLHQVSLGGDGDVHVTTDRGAFTW